MCPATAATRILTLTGGVGGAKLVLGLSRVVADDALTVIVNTGDDFLHLGLSISPDLDTLMYTLAGEVNPDTGWGCRDETWSFMAALERLGGETWFRLGDRDLATHVERTRRLNAGEPLSAVTRALGDRLGIGIRLLPMTDQPVHTRVHTNSGPLEFQHYFVRERARPAVTGLEYVGAMEASPGPGVLASLEDPGLEAIIIAPSNPYLSIDPILAIPAIRAGLRAAAAPVVAVSPIVGGAALKGPTAKIMAELGLEVSALAIAHHYQELLDGFILDQQDQEQVAHVEARNIAVRTCNTIMQSLEDKIELARITVDFARSLA